MSVADAVAPSDLYITRELQRRVPTVPDYLSEKLALQDIAAQIIDHPEQVLPKLVERAMEATGAESAGISAFETREGTAGIFRWRDLRGKLASFEGTTTPRDYSPCGVCLERFEPTLTRRPERYYTWIGEAGVACPEVLLVPLYVANGQPLGTLWIVSDREGHFDSGHARIMRELASFVGIALAMAQDKQRLLEAVKQQELLTAEMNHRVKNLFSIVDAMIRVSKRSATSADELATVLTGRLRALAAAHALVRPSFGPGHQALPPTITLRAVIHAILTPYETNDANRFSLAGPEVILGSQATTSLALVFHEFATNAAKHGAFAAENGRVSVIWEQRDANVILLWREDGGPAVKNAPAQPGFGSNLAQSTVLRLGGTFSLDWKEQGLAANFTLPLAELAR